MTAPVIIEKGRFRLVFSEPHGQGYISIQFDGHGLSMFLDADELMTLSGACLGAARRIRKKG